MYYSLGLGESSLDHRRREEFPAIFIIVESQRNTRAILIFTE